MMSYWDIGITTDRHLTFSKHINIICSNVARKLNSINCIQCNLDEKSRLVIYRSYIFSNFNYCPPVWHFCGIQNSGNVVNI